MVSDESKTALDRDPANPIGKDSIDADQMKDQVLSDFKQDLREHRFECRECGYIYDPKEGLSKYKISKGTAFIDLDKQKFRCPVCRSGFEAYKDIGAAFQPIEGFEENIKYGFGFNTLPPGQKNVLIFGGLALMAACFLSLYSLH